MDSTTDKKNRCSPILQIVCVTWAVVMVGISDSLLGPSLLDLQALLQTDLGMFNYIVLATGLFDFLGAILAGFLAKTADVHLRLCISLSTGAVVISMSAMVANYYYVLVAFCLQGLLRGIVYCYSMEKSSVICHNKDVVFQITSLGASAGGIIVPVILNQFLCTKQQTEAEVITYNQSRIPDIASRRFGFVPNTSISMSIPDGTCLPHDVRITYAYILLGIISLPPAVGFFAYWLGSKENLSDNAKVNEAESNTNPHGTLAIFFSVLFVLYYFPILGGALLYSTFLTDFGVQGPLHIGKSKMVLMTSLYWGSSFTGRILNIIITPFIGVEKILIVDIVLLIICETILVAAVSQSEIILWVCTCAIGAFVSPLVGAGFAWCESLVKVSPKIISASSASLALGGMALPFIGGVLIRSFGYMSFMYFLYANYVFVTSMFFFLFLVSRKLKQDPISISVNVDPSSQLQKAKPTVTYSSVNK